MGEPISEQTRSLGELVAGDILAEAQAPEAPQDAGQAAAEQDTETPEAEADTQVEEDIWNVDIPPEIQADIEDSEEDEPEEEEAEEEETPEAQYEPDEEDYEDPAVKSLQRKLAKQEKMLAKEREKNLKTARKMWVEKEAKFFPCALDPEGIAARATSRREFRRLAASEHKRAAPLFEKLLEARSAEIKAQAKQEWGAPVAGPNVPNEAQEVASAQQEARERGDFVGSVRALMFGPKGR